MDQVAKLLGRRPDVTFKRLGNNAKALTKFVYVTEVLPNITEYMVTDKADGERAFLIADENSSVYFTATEQQELKSTMDFVGVFDCELIDDVLYIFDVLEWNGQSLVDEPFRERHKFLLQIKPNKNVSAKTYKPLNISTYQMNIAAKYNERKPYQIDGLIFTSLNDSYLRTENFKWKPPNQLTIDFLYASSILWVGMNRRLWKRLGFPLPPNYRELLKPHINVDKFMRGDTITSEYFPVPFETSMQIHIDMPDFGKDLAYEGKIIELSVERDAKTKKYKWLFHHIRVDRTKELNNNYFGNDYRIAELTLQSALNPLTMNDLIASYTTITKGFYFRKQDDTYTAIRKFNNYVKKILIQRHATQNVVDLASGKGQDIMKYIYNKVSILNLVEIDDNAIEELIMRKYTMAEQIHVPDINSPINIRAGKPYGVILKVWSLDLNRPWKENAMHMKSVVGSKNIFCNFALHYMMWDLKHIENICAFVDHFLEKGCEFIFTAFDGVKVKQFIKKPWETEKYMVAASSKPNAIRVRLPCSDEPYDEPIIDLAILDRVFKKHKIMRTEHASFNLFLQDFRHHKPQFSRMLDSSDLKFIDLYAYTVYKKN